MPVEYELGKWIRLKWKTQIAFADKLGVHQGRVSRWLKGQDGISADYQAAIRKLGYTGPWPSEEAEDAAASGPAPYVTREELAELRGALKAHVEYWRTGEGKVLQRLEELAQRIEAIERRVNS